MNTKNKQPTTHNDVLNKLDMYKHSKIYKNNMSEDDIREEVFDVLHDDLEMDEKNIIITMLKLAEYMYVDTVADLVIGGYIMFIPLANVNNNDDLVLKHSGIVCDIKPTVNDYIVQCKNPMNRYYSFKMNECIVFRKLRDVDYMLMNVLKILKNDANKTKNTNKLTKEVNPNVIYEEDESEESDND